MVVRKIGVLITGKQPIFKQGDRFSKNLEALGPLFFKDLEIVENYFVGVVS